MSDFYANMLDAVTYKYYAKNAMDRRVAQQLLELAWDVRRQARGDSAGHLSSTDHVIDRLQKIPTNLIDSHSLAQGDDLKSLSVALSQLAADRYEGEYRVSAEARANESAQSASTGDVLDIHVFQTEGGWSWGPFGSQLPTKPCQVFATRREAQHSADQFYRRVMQKSQWLADDARLAIQEILKKRSDETWCEEALAESCMGGRVVSVTHPDGRDYIVAYRTFTNECTDVCNLFQVLRKDVEKLPAKTKLVHVELVECPAAPAATPSQAPRPKILCYVFQVPPEAQPEAVAYGIRQKLGLK